jgi:hypothetical protein
MRVRRIQAEELNRWIEVISMDMIFNAMKAVICCCMCMCRMHVSSGVRRLQG